MAYVRKKGNQLAIVHGFRNRDTRQVEQRTLFTLYSKAEALAAVGEGSHHFRNLLADDNPGIRLDWKKIDAGIREHLDHLPDVYPYAAERLEKGFRGALRDFAKEIMLADPQSLHSAARVLQANRHELAYLQELIGWRLCLCDQQKSRWNQDSAFYWRAASRRRQVPPEAEEKLSELYGKHQHDEATALARLLIECWPNYAEGHNYLGLIALERVDYDQATNHFGDAIRIGRTLFPKRIGKDSYWTDLDTRPYMRALMNQAQTLNRMEEYDEALELCDRLEKECGDAISAASHRQSIYLNAGQWDAAAGAARMLCEINPDASVTLAFALFEQGERREAFAHLLHVAIRLPRAIRMCLGMRTRGEPAGYDDVGDHNTGVHLTRDLAPYLSRMPRSTRRLLKELVLAPDVQKSATEAAEAHRRWRENASSGDREWFEKATHMRSLAFARERAVELDFLGLQ